MGEGRNHMRAVLSRVGTAAVLLVLGLPGAFTASAARAPAPDPGHTAPLAGNGTLMRLGREAAPGPVSQAEIFDPASGGFSLVGNSVVARADHTATLLGDGRVLIAGGRHFTTLLDATELFDPAT